MGRMRLSGMAAVRLQVVAAAASELSCSFVLADWSSKKEEEEKEEEEEEVVVVVAVVVATPEALDLREVATWSRGAEVFGVEIY